jgi:hypothetical protein
MIYMDYTGAGCGATVDELLGIAGESPVGGELGVIRTNIRPFENAELADKGRVNVARERIVQAICRAVFNVKMEDFESRFDDLLPENPVLVKKIRRIYDKTYYNTGVSQSGKCKDPHEQGFKKYMSGI